MKTSEIGFDFIKKEEQLSLKAYPDPGTGAEPWTIGYGSTMYDDGRKVQQGDVITKERAQALLEWEVSNKTSAMAGMIRSPLNQNQMDALTSFVYNCGIGAFAKSTMLKKINLNPNDPTIRDEFMRWVKAGGQTMPGLVNRRKREADLYFSYDPIGTDMA